ncbi:MAG TPA: PQQ-binding-like beta-propeller repeat protein [Patescibacteria group bacterium]|nr:PQQ-binding-like beta-propeller repeat protein [Patescibacteria group bacterium]
MKAINLLWKFKSDDHINSGIVANDDFVYFGSYDEYFYCLQVDNGRVIWKYKTNASITSTPVIFKDSIFFGNNAGALYCLNKHDGILNWSYNCGSNITTNIISYGESVIFGCWDNNIYSFSTGEPTPNWVFKTDGSVITDLSYNDNKLFLGGFNNNEDKAMLYSLDAEKGLCIWKKEYDFPSSINPSVFEDKCLLIAQANNKISYIDIKSGEIKDEFNVDDTITSPVCIENSMGYFGGTSGKIYSIDLNNKFVNWEFNSNYPIETKPVIIQDFVFVANNDGRILGFNKAKGEKVFDYTTGDSVLKSLNTHKTNLFVGSWDSFFYAFKIE